MSEYRSKGQYRQLKQFQISGDVRSLVCFCVDISGSMSETLSLWSRKTRIDLLSNGLRKMVEDFGRDPLMRDAVSIAIITYNNYAQVKEPFQDAELYKELKDYYRFEVDNTTNMSKALHLCLQQIKDIQRAIEDTDHISYTPILIFMTDGAPVRDDTWRDKFFEVSRMVENDHLHVFPVGISKEAKMENLVCLFPTGKVPFNFAERYCMLKEEDFDRVFEEVRQIIYKQHENFIDERRSEAANSEAESTQNGLYALDLLLKVTSR